MPVKRKAVTKKPKNAKKSVKKPVVKKAPAKKAPVKKAIAKVAPHLARKKDASTLAARWPHASGSPPRGARNTHVACDLVALGLLA